MLVGVDILQTFIPENLGHLIDGIQTQTITDQDLLKYVSYIIGCALGMMAGRVCWRLTLFHASKKIEAGIRHDMFLKAERLPVSYYHTNSVGTVMAWFTTDIETIEEYFSWGTIMLIDAIFLSVIVIVKMIININVPLTIIACIPLLLVIIWGALVEKFMAMKWDERQKAFDSLYDFAQENFTGIRVIKAFVKETQELHAFAKVARKNHDVNINFGRVSIVFDVIIEAIIALCFAIVMGFGGWFVWAAASGNPITLFGQTFNLKIGELTTFIGYFDSLIWPMIAMGSVVSMKSRAKASLKRITIFLDSVEDVKNCEDPIVFEKPISGSLVFNHFSFKYPSNEYDSLKDISLEIKSGESIGVVGKIGCGKTTFVNSLLRLYNIEDNSILIDGTDLMKVDIKSLRDQIAYVPQDNFLFSDTISHNIGFCDPNMAQEDIENAAKFADVHDNIIDFKDGYETISGERGVTLSGGQKQRISIARAYAKNAPIMILDDSVSAVDVKTEETILGNIKELRKDKTTIVVASRVSTVKDLDKIIVLNNGSVEAFDTHENLLKTSPTYKRMVYLQKLEEEVEGGKTK